MTQARTLEQWLNDYGQSHQNKVNKAIHLVCVPIIYWTIVGLFWSIPTPASWELANFSLLVLLVASLFYLRLSLPLTLGMAGFTLGCMGIFAILESYGLSVFLISISVFVVAWVFQFVGHYLEGEKPSFFEDLQFLMIGPAWVLNHCMQKIGLSSVEVNSHLVDTSIKSGKA